MRPDSPDAGRSACSEIALPCKDISNQGKIWGIITILIQPQCNLLAPIQRHQRYPPNGKGEQCIMGNNLDNQRKRICPLLLTSSKGHKVKNRWAG